MAQPAPQVRVAAEPNPFVDFYRENEISPVAQDISDLDRHFARRAALYRHVGLPPRLVGGRTIVEFGPGSGHNAVYTASLGPSRYVLVDGNPVGLERTGMLLAEHGAAGHECVASMFEDFDTDERFDIVLCEGVIPLQTRPAHLLRHVARFAAPGGLVVMTCMDSVSQIAEIMRRLIAALVVDPGTSTEGQVELLRPLFAPHLATLSGRSRLVDDWILDVIVRPWLGEMLSVADAVAALDGDFHCYGASPDFLTDWRWYKDVRDGYNEAATTAYWRNLHNFLDYRLTFDPRTEAENRPLREICDDLYALTRRFEHERRPGTIEEIGERLAALGGRVAAYSPTTASAILDFHEALAHADGDGLGDLGGFAALFGRGQQYLSFVRR